MLSNKLKIKFYTDEGEKIIKNMEESFELGGKDSQGYYFRHNMCEIHYTIETARVFHSPAKQTVVFAISALDSDDAVKSYHDLIAFLKTQKQPYRWAKNLQELGV